MKQRVTGIFKVTSKVGGEEVRAFFPHALPPDSPVVLTDSLNEKINNANVALGRLDGISTVLSDTDLFLYSYIRKEAVLSSQIEGTQSSLSDLLLFELNEVPGVPIDDVQEVSNYVLAMQHGLKRIKEGFPLSNRLIREIHAILLRKGRGKDKEPGEFRKSQNWIGGSRPGNAKYVPPPPLEVEPCMTSLEKFLHDDPFKTATLLKAALAHVQFETIHPFLDGNGRVGRLLITLLFCIENILQQPTLYLSLYFKKHRTKYYDLLQKVRTEGVWEEWISFFCDAISETAQEASTKTKRLLNLFERDRIKIKEIKHIAGSCLNTHQVLTTRPIVNIKILTQKTKLSFPTVTNCIRKLSEIGIVKEVTGHQRNKIFVYTQYMKILESE